MAFCSRCGKRLDEGAAFCSGCGAPISTENDLGGRKEVWEGSVHKCSNCGHAVGAFDLYCPACGIELRDKDASRSVSELFEKLEAIDSESSRGSNGGSFFSKTSRRGGDNHPKGFLANLFSSFSGAVEQASARNDIDQRKINLIKMYPIPNTVEDILEFVILASSNVDPKAYSPGSTAALGKPLSDAWLSKCEQAIRKAEVTFKGSTLIVDMKEMLNEVQDNISRARKKGAALLVLELIGPWILILLLLYMTGAFNPSRSVNEINRLEGIVADIEQDLESGEYDRALLNAQSLDPADYLSAEEQREWSVAREYWIDRVQDEAAENGVDLSSRASKHLESISATDEEASTGFLDGFVSGFMDGVDSG